MFLLCSDWPSRVSPMPDQPLRPATAQEVTESLAFALRYDGRKRVYTGHDFMARITAERLVEHLARSGFVLMKQPPATAPSLPGSTPPHTRLSDVARP